MADYSVAQVIIPGLQQSEIKYYQSKPPLVRAMQDMDRSQREDYANQISDGYPDKPGSVQVDVQINVYGWNSEATMRQRQLPNPPAYPNGLPWVLAMGMSPALTAPTATVSADSGTVSGGIAGGDPANMPKGAIVVTIDFGPPSPDLVVPPNYKPFRWRQAPGPDQNDPNGIGSTWYPNDGENYPVLAYWTPDPSATALVFWKINVIGYMGAVQLLWVRVK
jgi:hypothetical protein